LTKQQERLFDDNIPEVANMYSGLDQKYKKITQLKEEFNEIKTLFGKKKED
jgi:hypothetical protein